MAQPEGEPVNLAVAARRAKVAEDSEDLLLSVAAANAFVRGLPVADLPEAEEGGDPLAWPATVELGATMLAALLTRRANTADGVYQIGQDGVAFVRRNDPHIALLLQLGDEAKPSVG